MTDPVGRKRGRYAVEPGGRHSAPSVTMVLGVLNKPGLPWGAARETALFAVFHQGEWIDLPPAEAIERLRKHHRGVWDDKASRGTLVHDLACRWAKGEEVDCPTECDPYLDALEAFYRDHRPEWVEVERTVIYDVEGEEFGGSFDAVARLRSDGSLRRLDLKTGKRYPIETTLQLAAYEFAPSLGVYDETGALAGTEPNPRTDARSVLYLHDDGTYELLDVPADEAAFEQFLALRRAFTWLKDMESWERAHPEIVSGRKPEEDAA